MKYVFKVPEVASVAVEGNEGRFPVHRIYCVGRNYAAHAREMGHNPDREPPFYFSKPADAIMDSDAEIPYPPATENLHHEVELVVAIGRAGKDISVGQALGHVYGYGVGIDLTRRDLQGEAKEKGRPWDVAKGFDHSAPCGAIRSVDQVGHPVNNRIWLSVNGVMKQESDIRQMIWSVPEVIANLSTLFTLKPGDLIFTGTPEGVGPLVRGDRICCGVDTVGDLNVTIV